MAILQTSERSTHLDPSENVIFQRHLVAYKESVKYVYGTVLEIGCGEGYGLQELAPKSNQYIAIDKDIPQRIYHELESEKNIILKQMSVPPIKGIDDNSIDCVIAFQVIEHIKKDKLFLSEIYRVLKPGGKMVLTTPNKKMTLTRNPWHIREYTSVQMKEILMEFFANVQQKGVFGNEKVMAYYEKNKESVAKITRFDILNFQYLLPRWIMQIPYDILNRLNRHHLQDNNREIANSVTVKDYSILEASNVGYSYSINYCLDHFCIATK